MNDNCKSYVQVNLVIYKSSNKKNSIPKFNFLSEQVFLLVVEQYNEK